MPHSWTIRMLAATTGALLATAVTAHGNPSPHDQLAADTAFRASAAHQLASTSDVDAMVTAATLDQLGAGSSKQAMSLLDRAVRKAPKAADISLLDLTLCSMRQGCDVLRRERQLRRIDPANGIAWMASLHTATQAHDDRRINEILGQMAKTRRFDVHFVSLGRRFIKALGEVAPVAQPVDASDATLSARRYMMASNVLTALTIPAYQDLLTACSPETTTSDARRDSCRKVAQSLQRGDIIVTHLVGLQIAQWTATGAEAKVAATQRRRQLQWRVSRLGAIAGNSPAAQVKQAEGMFVHEREIDNVDAMLTAAGEPLDPPRGWQLPPQGTRAHHSP